MPRPFFEDDSLMLVATQGNEFRPVGDLTITAPSPGELKDHLIIKTNTGRSVAFTVVDLTAITIAAQTLPDPRFRDALDVELLTGERD